MKELANGGFREAYAYLCSLNGTEKSSGEKTLTISHEGSGDGESGGREFVRVVDADKNAEVTFFVDPQKGIYKYVYRLRKKPEIPLIKLFDGRNIPTPGLTLRDCEAVIGSPLHRWGFPDEPTEEELIRQAQEYSINLAQRAKIFLDSLENPT